MQHFNTKNPEEIIMIGDRLLTDIGMSNLMGFKSILVEPIRPTLDPFTVQLVSRQDSTYMYLHVYIYTHMYILAHLFLYV